MTADEALTEIAGLLGMTDPARSDVVLAVKLLADEHRDASRALTAVCDTLDDKEPEKPLTDAEAVRAAVRTMERVRALEWAAREQAVALSKAEHDRDLFAEVGHRSTVARRMNLAEIAEAMGGIPPKFWAVPDALAKGIVARSAALRLVEEATPVDPAAGRRALDEDPVAWLVYRALDAFAVSRELIAERFGVDAPTVGRVIARGRDVAHAECAARAVGLTREKK